MAAPYEREYWILGLDSGFTTHFQLIFNSVSLYCNFQVTSRDVMGYNNNRSIISTIGPKT